ncbi:FAD-dependent oxidoreductase [Microlunatus soli]|uniref:Assimilatory nitrate reductase (NADH) beta subunit n=1 Tax=Microlunatus soli TaxID=630515 RepID=A0A1H1VBE4_9ACTN|nr:FAD-dependent oxidoreductase [Microlunatus soli]SDS82087.1 assimilatory nitrate reductase (NADH) beta subunit [Microlunatus soli]
MAAVRHRRARRLVIIGFGPVAARLIDDLRPAVRDRRLQILIIGAESEPAYNRIMIGEVALGRTDPEMLIMSDPAELRSDGVDVRLGTAVIDIDRGRRYVTLGDGDQYAYDQLVFATGAAARAPRLNGLRVQPGGTDPVLPDGVAVLRDLADASRLRSMTGPGRRLVVLGGGVLGMELALTAAEEGAAVFMVHTGRVPMERNLDGIAAGLVARHLRRRQVTVIADAQAADVRLESGRFAALALADGRQVAGDALLLCCGAAPRTTLAERIGLSVDNGIVVDHELRSPTDDAIFAIGDCARIRCADPSCDRCAPYTGPSGLIGPGWAQAEWLARRLMADKPTAPLDAGSGNAPVMIVKAPGLSIVSAGRIDSDPLDALLDDDASTPGVAQWSDPEHGRYAKMITRDGALEGLICVGMPRTAAELTLLYERRAELPGDRSALLRHDGPDHATVADPAGPEVTICRCNGVTAGQIGAAVDEGHDDIAAIGRATRAGTGCGTCKDRICELLNNRAKVVMA